MSNFPEGTIAIGGSGMLGYYLPKEIPNFDFSGGYDITIPTVLEKIFKNPPKVVLHLAAVTDVVGSEYNATRCYDVNTVASYHIARHCKKIGAKMIFISSVDVFDGEKETPYTIYDVPNPIVVYGHSKAMAEAVIRSVLPDATILRAGWMFGGIERDKKFCSYIVKQIKDGVKEIRAVNDRRGSPTFAKDLVEIMAKMSTEKGGLYQACNTGVATRFDEAKIIADVWEYKGDVIGVPQSSFPDFRALKNATMVTSFNMRSWEDAMREYAQDWRQHG